MKRYLVAAALFLGLIAFADTPPPGVVGIKGGTDGTTIGNVTDSLKVNVTNPSSGTVTISSPLPLPVVIASPGTVTAIVSPNPLPVVLASPTNLPVTVTNTPTVNVNNFPATQPVSFATPVPVSQSGTWTNIVTQSIGSDLHADIDNFPASQTVNGTLTCNQGTPTDWLMNLVEVGSSSISLGTNTAANSLPVTLATPLPTLPVNVENFPATTTVVQSTGASLHVDVDNYPSTQPVSGTVTANQGSPNTNANAWPVMIATPLPTLPVTVGNFPATQAVTSAQLPPSLGTQSVANSLSITPATGSSFAVTGNFWQATQPVSGTVTSQIEDSAGNTLNSTSHALDVYVSNAASGGSSATDEATFTAGATSFTANGGVYNDSITALSSGQQGAVRSTPYRAEHVNLRDNSGNQLLGSKTSANSVPVVIASDQAAIPVIIPSGSPIPVAISSPSVFPVTGNVADGASEIGKPVAVAGEFNLTLPSYSNGQRTELQSDVNGRLIVTEGNQSASGAISTLNGTLPLAASSIGSVFVYITGTYSGTIQFQGSIDGTNFVPLYAQTGGLTGGFSNAALTSGFTGGVRLTNVGAFSTIQAKMTAYTSGSATVEFNTSQGTAVVQATQLNPANLATNAYLLDGTGNAISSTTGSLNVNVTNAAGGTSATDAATWTAGSSTLTPTGGVFNDSATALASGHEGTVRLTTDRAMHVNLRDAAGNQLLGSKVSASSVPVVIASDDNVSTTPSTAQASATVGTLGNLALGAASANAPTDGDGNNYPLSLDTAGNLRVIDPAVLGQGFGTAGKSGYMVQGSVTTSAPAYATGDIYPLSLDTSGNLRVTLASGTVSSNIAQYGGVATSLGQKSMSASVPVTLATDQSTINVNLGDIGGSSYTLGSKTSANSAPVVIASDDTVTVSGTVTTSPPSHASTNIDEYGGAATSLGSKVSASSIPVVIASDQGAVAVSGTVTTSPPSNASTNIAEINGVVPLMGNGVTGTGSLRVTLASDTTSNSNPFLVNLGDIGGSSYTLGSKTSANSAPVVIASDDTVTVSGTVTTSPPSNASTNIAEYGGAATSLGSKVSASSVPVVIASDQGAVAVSGTVSAKTNDGSGNSISSTSGALDVYINGSAVSSGGTSAIDGAGFTAGTSTFTPTGGVFNDSVAALTSGDQGTARLTANRAIHANLRDASGNQLIGSKISANSIPVVIASDQGTLAVSPPADSSPATQTITIQDTGSTQTSQFNGQLWYTGTATTGSTAAFTLSSNTTGVFQTSGTWTGTLEPEISIDGGTTWTPHTCHQVGTSSYVASWTSNLICQVSLADRGMIRIRATSAITGTATILIRESNSVSEVHVETAVKLIDGSSSTSTNLATIKAGTVSPASSDTSLVVGLNPNAPLPAGTNSIGTVVDTQSTASSLQVTDNQATASNLNAQVVGNIASGSSDSGNPVKVGGVAYTALTSAATAGNRQNLITDDQGAIITYANTERALIQYQETTITSSVSETTIITSQSSAHADIISLTITNSSATPLIVTLKDSTGGTIRAIYALAPYGGITINPSVPMPQVAAVSNNWTLTCGTSVASVYVSAVFTTRK